MGGLMSEFWKKSNAHTGELDHSKGLAEREPSGTDPVGPLDLVKREDPGKQRDRRTESVAKWSGKGFWVRMGHKLFYDRRDHELIGIVNRLSDDPAQGSLEYTRKIYYPFFHPLGIKELSESKGLRTAYSVVHLLSSLERGDEERRLQALRGLRDEVIDTRTGPMPLNSARVLLQLMKELVRAQGDYGRQLELAHDFRQTASGKPGMIRKQLAKYHLLEMPESWHQITFDDHVHDANTQGRKTPTHLIMDAWIKGIRRLRVVYYHYLEPRFVSEVYEAARIMGIEVRIAVEFSVRYRDRFVSIHWVARGFPDAPSFLCFLAEPQVMAFMEKGKAVTTYQKKYVLQVLEAFNTDHRDRFIEETGISLSPIDRNRFLAFVSPGQASILHLGEYIHHLCLEGGASPASLPARVPGENRCFTKGMVVPDTATILERYLSAENYPDILCPWSPCNGEEVPERLKLSLKPLLRQLSSLHYSYRITLNVSQLSMEDVLELLYDGGGMIRRLEIVNLKDYAADHRHHIPAINALQQAVNDGNPLRLKRLVRQAIHRVEQAGYPDGSDRRKKLISILHDLENFRQMYRGVALKTRIGSDSTGRSLTPYGMGLGIVETLPFRARREILKHPASRLRLPLHLRVYPCVISIPRIRHRGRVHGLLEWIGRIPGLEYLGARKIRKWELDSYSTLMTEGPGNIVSLGGGSSVSSDDSGNGGRTTANESREVSEGKKTLQRRVSPRKGWNSLNSGVKNSVKVFIGFVPAFLTFALTKEWWVLAWFGAFIWFGITGLRNVAQSVLGGGGIVRSPLLRWNDYVSWERLADSLLFTGFSVPLLDFLVKTLFLDHGLGITVANQPVVLYAVMASANGIYLASHNAFRGFPKAAILANLFRSLFSIPIAVSFSSIIGVSLTALGVVGVESVLQKWAAVISKGASDLVAALIEGPADRFQNIALRTRDYKRKLSELFDVYARLELLFPDTVEFSLLEDPERLIQDPNAEVRDLMTVIIIHALDLLYFWMYQPRARTTLQEMMLRFSPEERIVFLMTQQVLVKEQMVSRLLVEGVLGRKFAKPLSFYLMRYEEYLAGLKKIDALCDGRA